MDKELLNKALRITKEDTALYMPNETTPPSSPIMEYYKGLRKNIDVFLQQDKILIEKLETLQSAIDGLGLFDGKNKKILSERIKSIEATRDTMHEKLISWWEEYDSNCPINVKTTLTPVGETVCFGFYKNFKEGFTDLTGKIEWKVLSKKNGKALLISNKILDVVPYSSVSLESWPTSVLRKWCQDLYAKNFTAEEKQFIIPVILTTPETKDGIQNWESVFCLSATDVQTYMPTYEDRYAEPTEIARNKFSSCWDYMEDVVPSNRRISGWWTRTSTPRTKEASCVLDFYTTEYRANTVGITINRSRKLYSSAYKCCPMGVRPAIIVSVDEW